MDIKINRLKKLRVGAYLFDVFWEKDFSGGSFSYRKRFIKIGWHNFDNEENIYHRLSHELMEMAAVEMNIRLHRPDVLDDFIFVYDH